MKKNILQKGTNEAEAYISAKLDRIERLSALSSKELLNLNDVAILTGLSKSYLYRLTSTHKIPYYKPSGKIIYFDRKDVEDWMKQNRVASTQEAEASAVNYVVGKEAAGYERI